MDEPLFYGLDLDQHSRCRHYHSELDIVALKCGKCQRYYACYQCHDALTDHVFQAASANEPHPVLCGVCRQQLSLSDYKTGACPICQSPFNPKCSNHYDIYFEK